jgi:hypothetical protein
MTAGEETMNVIELIKKNTFEIVTGAANAIERAHLPHYGFADTGQARQRLQTLCDLTLECPQTQSTAPMSRYAEVRKKYLERLRTDAHNQFDKILLEMNVVQSWMF